jgi:hypothetical protein
MAAGAVTLQVQAETAKVDTSKLDGGEVAERLAEVQDSTRKVGARGKELEDVASDHPDRITPRGMYSAGTRPRSR